MSLRSMPGLRRRDPRVVGRLVRAAYLLVLHREPDPAGAATHGARLSSGGDFSSLLEQLASSDEMETLHPRLGDDPRLAELLCRLGYALLLRRDPDPGALAHWRQALAEGQDWRRLLGEVIASAEFTEVADSERAMAGVDALWRVDELLDRLHAAEQRAERVEAQVADLRRAVERLGARAWDAEAVSRRLAALEDRAAALEPGT